MIEKLLRFFRPQPQVIRARAVTDAQLLEALAMDPESPVLQAFLELIDRARSEARANARAIIKNERETIFALGGEEALDRLQDYLLNLRAEALRQHNQI